MDKTKIWKLKNIAVVSIMPVTLFTVKLKKILSKKFLTVTLGRRRRRCIFVVIFHIFGYIGGISLVCGGSTV